MKGIFPKAAPISAARNLSSLWRWNMHYVLLNIPIIKYHSIVAQNVPVMANSVPYFVEGFMKLSNLFTVLGDP